VSWLRATVYGALVISPRFAHSYPFPKPDEEATILLGLTPNINYTLLDLNLCLKLMEEYYWIEGLTNEQFCLILI
jgi:hypothetical protein